MNKWYTDTYARVRTWPDGDTSPRTIAECNTPEQARLMAAAPDLLAALKRAEPALWLVATSGNADAVAIYEQARAAIAKAKGGN